MTQLQAFMQTAVNADHIHSRRQQAKKLNLFFSENENMN